jgi:hypothetical protein
MCCGSSTTFARGASLVSVMRQPLETTTKMPSAAPVGCPTRSRPGKRGGRRFESVRGLAKSPQFAICPPRTLQILHIVRLRNRLCGERADRT